jgi:hypothetical protein
MDVLDDVGSSDAQDVAVVQQILFIGQKPIAPRIRLFESVTANRGAHRPIDNQDALVHGGFEFRADVGTGRHEWVKCSAGLGLVK